MNSCTRTSAGRVTGRSTLALCLWGLLVTACQQDQGQVLQDEVITVGCARCMFHMEGAVGCPFAAEIAGKHYPIQGHVPEAHQSHAADGICNMTRQARVSGRLKDGKLITTSLELLPATEIPTERRYTEEDVH